MKKLPVVPTLMVVFFVVLMTSLGFWQVNRAEQKKQLLSLLKDDNVTTIEKSAQLKDLPRYSHVILKGSFLSSHQLLLDNQFNEKKLGYHVFTPFKLYNHNTIIMVNRGWVNKQGFDPQMIAVDQAQGLIHGRLNRPPEVGVQLGEISLKNDDAPQLVTYYDEQKINSFLYEQLCDGLNCVVSDRIVLLSADQKNQTDRGFLRAWKPVIMPPSKHIAYAVQWFSMTVVLIIIFVYWLTKTRSDEIE